VIDDILSDLGLVLIDDAIYIRRLRAEIVWRGWVSCLCQVAAYRAGLRRGATFRARMNLWGLNDD
jgi:hypothetical protein